MIQGQIKIESPTPVERGKLEQYECWLFGDGWFPLDKYLEGYNKLSKAAKRSYQNPAKMKIRVKPCN
jgi:hypothetical protein